MNVNLSWFDPMGWTFRRADMERALYAAACAGDGDAAAELQFWQAKFGSLEAKEVDSSLREGQLLNQLRLTAIATTPNQRHGTEWHQLQAFGVSNRKTGPKSSAKLLELRHAFGQLLTIDDLRAAATTEFATATRKKEKPKLAREDWPETASELESELVDYVCHHFKKTEHAAALAYAHESFPGLLQFPPDEQVIYPPDW